MGACSNPWITFSWDRAAGWRARAAEPRPTAPRNDRRVSELMEECFSDAARRSEPDWLSDFMPGSMSRPEAASIQKSGFRLPQLEASG